MAKRLGSIALAAQAVVLAVLLLAPEVDAWRLEGLAGIGGWGVEAVQFPLSHTTTTPPAPGAPVITSFTPTSGGAFANVQINGTNLVDVSAVSFGGVPATSFFFLGNSGVAQVPFGAATGPISVTNPFGTGVSHDNFVVGPFVLGGKNMTASYSGTSPIRLSWSSGTEGQEYYALRTDLTHGAGPIAIGPFPGHYFQDYVAPEGALICYVVTPLVGSQVLGLSDMVCGMSGISEGSFVAQNFSLGLSQSDTAGVQWSRTFSEPIDASVVVAIPLTGGAPQQLLMPPGVQTYAHATGGNATCFVVLTIRFDPAFEYGVTNMLCGFPGISTLGGAASAGLNVDGVALRVQQAMATVQLPDLAETLAAARAALAAGE